MPFQIALRHIVAGFLVAAATTFGASNPPIPPSATDVPLAKQPGKETAVAQFLEGALPLANQESTTPVWFALRLGPSTFGIFDAFRDEAGRRAHLAGPIAAALMANATELLAQPPQIEQVDLLAVKLPK